MRFALWVWVGLFGACGHATGTPDALTEPVTLVVTLDPSIFAPTAVLDVRVWNAEQLQTLEANARCVASQDAATGATRFVCPDGVEYRDVTPERFELSAAALGGRIELKSAAIRVGERFRLRIAGLHRDNCNTTSADLVREARSARVIVEKLAWQTTAKACLKGAPS